MKIQHIDHVGIVVNDLEAAKEFFVDFGFKVLGRSMVQGEWVDRLIGLHNVRTEIVMLEAPDGQLNLELSRFLSPETIEVNQSSNALGIRHIAFTVEDIDGIVKKLKQKGMETTEVHNFQDVYKLCYVRGPEGITLELAERLG